MHKREKKLPVYCKNKGLSWEMAFRVVSYASKGLTNSFQTANSSTHNHSVQLSCSYQSYKRVGTRLLTPGAFNTQGCSAGRAPLNPLCGSRTCAAAHMRHRQRAGSLLGARPSAPQPKRAQGKSQSTSALTKTTCENIWKQSHRPPACSNSSAWLCSPCLQG